MSPGGLDTIWSTGTFSWVVWLCLLFLLIWHFASPSSYFCTSICTFWSKWSHTVLEACWQNSFLCISINNQSLWYNNNLDYFVNPSLSSSSSTIIGWLLMFSLQNQVLVESDAHLIPWTCSSLRISFFLHFQFHYQWLLLMAETLKCCPCPLLLFPCKRMRTCHILLQTKNVATLLDFVSSTVCLNCLWFLYNVDSSWYVYLPVPAIGFVSLVVCAQCWGLSSQMPP